MPGAGLSAKGAMLAPPRGAGQQEPFRAPCPQREFAVSRVSPLAGGGGSLCPSTPPGEDRPGDSSQGRGTGRLSPARAGIGAAPGSAPLGCSRPLPSPGGQHGEGAGAPDWNHMEAHLQLIRPGASSSCLAGCAANLWGLSAPPRFPQRMFPGRSAAGLRAELRPRQP